jgi:Spx/MgsR family transcriptional regulator
MATSSASVTLYGIANCDTVKRARAHLAAAGAAVQFHDFKKAGVPEHGLDAWMAAFGWQRLLNRQGSTWRKLDAAAQAAAGDAAGARALMLAQPSVIRRPVVLWPDGSLTLGFDAAEFGRRLRA